MLEQSAAPVRGAPKSRRISSNICGAAPWNEKIDCFSSPTAKNSARPTRARPAPTADSPVRRFERSRHCAALVSCASSIEHVVEACRRACRAPTARRRARSSKALRLCESDRRSRGGRAQRLAAIIFATRHLRSSVACQRRRETLAGAAAAFSSAGDPSKTRLHRRRARPAISGRSLRTGRRSASRLRASCIVLREEQRTDTRFEGSVRRSPAARQAASPAATAPPWPGP